MHDNTYLVVFRVNMFRKTLKENIDRYFGQHKAGGGGAVKLKSMSVC